MTQGPVSGVGNAAIAGGKSKAIAPFYSSPIVAIDTNEHAIPHGLGVIRTIVMVTGVGDVSGAGWSNPYESTPADATNCYVTSSVGSGWYQVLAFA